MDVLNFVIVGEVDHGKSTLIGRLLYDTGSLPSDKIEEVEKACKDLGKETEFAFLLDYLEEERQQGITIDTTHVFFKTKERHYVIIDAPGHVKFVKNMVTGASQAESAILIIDVKDGVKEQTKRHAYMLSLLGLTQIIVAVNKMDLVAYSKERFDEVVKQLKGFLDSINIEPIFYIPICAINGENVAGGSKKIYWYNGPTLLDALEALVCKESATNKPLIFPIQDVYKIGDKRITVGRIEAGSIKKGLDIKILPRNGMAKVRSIERYLKETDEAYAGQSIGITTEDDIFVDRGDVICLPSEEAILTDRFSASIFWLSKEDFQKAQRLVLRCATQERFCKIEDIKKRIDSSSLQVLQDGGEVLKNLEVGEVVVKTKEPIAIKSFNEVQELGRFVLVRNEDICAGGIVTKVY